MATWLASRACWVGAGHDLAARHDGRIRCLAVVWRLPIGLKGGSEARLRLSGGKPGDAATLTHAHRHLLMTIDIDGPSVQGAAGSEAELQLGSFCHSQHAFDAVWLLWTDLQSARAASSVSAGASFTLHVSCTSRRVVQTFLACFSTWR